MVIEDAYEFTKPNPWRWPNEFEIEDALESVRQMGGQVVRTYVLSVHREGSDMGEFVHVRGPGEFNEEGFRALDKVIEVARRKGIRVIIPLVDQASGGAASASTPPSAASRPTTSGPIRRSSTTSSNRAVRAHAQEHVSPASPTATIRRSSAGKRATKSTPRPSGPARSRPTSRSSIQTTW